MSAFFFYEYFLATQNFGTDIRIVLIKILDTKRNGLEAVLLLACFLDRYER